MSNWMPAGEVEAMLGVAHGETAEETAKRRGISVHTVKSQRQSAVKRVRAKNLTHAIFILTPALRSVDRQL